MANSGRGRVERVLHPKETCGLTDCSSSYIETTALFCLKIYIASLCSYINVVSYYMSQPKLLSLGENNFLTTAKRNSYEIHSKGGKNNNDTY